MDFTFNKTERLKSEKLIAKLFSPGNQSFLAYPIRVVWMPLTVPSKSLVQVMVSAPKKTFKSAVARNRIKRLLREAWRLHKHEYYEKCGPEQQPIALMLMYIAKEELPLKEIEAGVKKLIGKLVMSDK